MTTMSKHFMDRLANAVADKDSRVVVGLDTDHRRLPECFIRGTKKAVRAIADAQLAFNRSLIDALHQTVPAVKIQIAFYEVLGSEGIRSYRETITYAHEKNLLVIGDIKRADIGSTAEAYAIAHVGTDAGADAVTLNPYLGFDSIEPFLTIGRSRGIGVFVLVRTSNPSAPELQDLLVKFGDQHEKLFIVVGRKVFDWGTNLVGESGFSRVGAVVGATYPEEARRLRELLPTVFFLVPGYGAQGATAKDVAACFTRSGQGAVVNASRSIIFAYEKIAGTGASDVKVVEAALQATENMRREINSEVRDLEAVDHTAPH